MRSTLDAIAARDLACIVVDDVDESPPALRRGCRRARTRRCSASPLPSVAADRGCCARYLRARSPRSTTLHGVFLDVLGMGVLITGDSGVGKSELALELISRGNGLVADDVVELSRIGAGDARRPLPAAAARISSRCAASACSTSAPSSARPRCGRARS